MAFKNYSSREINLKLVFWGPAGCGRRTIFDYIYKKTRPEARSLMRTYYGTSMRHFEFQPLSLGEIRGFKTRFHLYIAPTESFSDASRKLVMKGLDGLCFVADSQEDRFEANMESLEDLRVSLNEQGYELDRLPFVIQYNKRDLPNAMYVRELDQALNTTGVPYFETVATTGQCVFDALKGLARQVLVEQRKEDGEVPPLRARVSAPIGATPMSTRPKSSYTTPVISGEIPATPPAPMAMPIATTEDPPPPEASPVATMEDPLPTEASPVATTEDPPPTEASPVATTEDPPRPEASHVATTDDPPPSEEQVVESSTSEAPAETLAASATSSGAPHAGRKTPLEALHVLLCRLYHEASVELRRFVRIGRDGDDILTHLPGIGEPLVRQVDELLANLERRGLIGATLERLSEQHPRHRDEVERITAAYLAGTHVEPLDVDMLELEAPGIDELARELAEATARRERLREAGLDTSAVEQEILALRRRRRDGVGLFPGDELDRGRYLLIREIGRGGFGTVWQARDRKGTVDVAIKVLLGQYAGDSSRKERFFRGARRMKELEHDGIVKVLDVGGHEAGHYFFVMELVEGGDLRSAVKDGRVTCHELVPIILRVGDALAHAHGRGLIHRDIKPANILLTAAGAPKLTDFDLVGAANTTGGTRTGAMGTVIYSAPEQLIRPQDATVRADIFGLGMTLMFGLAGDELPVDVLRRPKVFIQRLVCGEPLKKVVRRATAEKVERRYASVAEFGAHLLAAAENTPDGARALGRALGWLDPTQRMALVARMPEVLDEIADDALSSLLGADSAVIRAAVQAWERHAAHAQDPGRCVRDYLRAAWVLEHTFGEDQAAADLLATASVSLCSRFALTPSAASIVDVKLRRRALLRKRRDWAALAVELAHEAAAAADPRTRIELRLEAADLVVDRSKAFLPGIFLLAVVLDDLPDTPLRSQIQDVLASRLSPPEIFTLVRRALAVAVAAKADRDVDPELAFDLWHAASSLEPEVTGGSDFVESSRCVAPPGALMVPRLNLGLAYCGADRSGKSSSLRYVRQHAASRGLNPGTLTAPAAEGSHQRSCDFESANFTLDVHNAPSAPQSEATVALQRADAIVFVVDSLAERLVANREALQQTRGALQELSRATERVPWIIQYNRQDLPGALPVCELREQLGLQGLPGYRSNASTGEGVFDAFTSALLHAALHRKCDPRA